MAAGWQGGGRIREEAVVVTRRSGRGEKAGNASRRRFGIVMSDYHPAVARRLLRGALQCLAEHRVNPGEVPVYRVPGAFEIPQAASRLLRRPDHGFDALICLGLLIRGETLHFDLLAREVCGGIARIARETGVPLAFGVLTVENERQARDRSGEGSSNKGREAARSIALWTENRRSLESSAGTRTADSENPGWVREGVAGNTPSRCSIRSTWEGEVRTKPPRPFGRRGRSRRNPACSPRAW
jgi:6,7-dimethyl-8-ribityllumazine synthase